MVSMNDTLRAHGAWIPTIVAEVSHFLIFMNATHLRLVVQSRGQVLSHAPLHFMFVQPHAFLYLMLSRLDLLKVRLLRMVGLVNVDRLLIRSFRLFLSKYLILNRSPVAVHNIISFTYLEVHVKWDQLGGASWVKDCGYTAKITDNWLERSCSLIALLVWIQIAGSAVKTEVVFTGEN
jgi:hypothetical protein